MKNRNLFVYLLAFLVTLSFVMGAVAQEMPPDVDPTELILESETTDTVSDFTVTAYLVDDSGNALEGYELEFSFGKDTDGDDQLEEVIYPSSSTTTFTDTTDENGYAKYTFDNYETAGTDYDYRVYFAGTENYDYTMNTAAVEIEKTPTVLEVRSKPPPNIHLWLPHQDGVMAYELWRHTRDLDPKGNRVYSYTLPDPLGGVFS